MSFAPVLVLILAGMGFLGFGIAYALLPTRMARLTDLTLASPTARVDFIATYGGFQIGFGLFLLACSGETSWRVPGLWATLLSLAGFASLRALTVLVHRGQVRSSIWFGLALEVFGMTLSAWALTQLR